MHFGVTYSNTSDVEYLGDYVTEIRYYEDWNEYIHQTCTSTSTDADGNTTTTTYDCSYVDYHPEIYYQIYSSGGKNEISKKEYFRLYGLWSTSSVFIDMKRNYHTNDGDCYVKSFDGLIYHSKTITQEHKYKNKIKSSSSIFGFSKITELEAKKIGLFEYPKIYEQSKSGFFSGNDNNQSPFLGYNPKKEELILWQWINGYYGPKNQFRTYNLVFYNKPMSIVQDQKSYWQGGNKNEMIVCICLDSATNKLMWVDAFSWADKPTYEVNLRSYFNDKEQINWIDFANWTKNSIPKYWKRKEFKDFDYIQIELTNNQIMWILIIIFLFNFAMSTYIVLNNHDYEQRIN